MFGDCKNESKVPNRLGVLQTNHFKRLKIYTSTHHVAKN